MVYVRCRWYRRGCFPGPEADWSVFANGSVRFRFDGGEPVSVGFSDGNTLLSIPSFDPMGSAIAGRLLEADIILVQVSIFRGGTETDTFTMQGAAPLLEQSGCRF